MNSKSNILEDIIEYKKINGIMNNIIKGIDDISREIIMKNTEIKLEKKPIKNISKKVRKEKRKVKRENDKCINIIIKILIIKISNKRKDTKTVELVKESDLKSGGLCPRRGVSSAVEQLTADQ
ncbi:hypothetical protein H8356DRAFT_1321502 [Neocallimastix lanati (nom. inval.)]|nr:hypothetical protein H8356DRAFT_1321502 [Neocallimastix sp. JGI-2020a]